MISSTPKNCVVPERKVIDPVEARSVESGEIVVFERVSQLSGRGDGVIIQVSTAFQVMIVDILVPVFVHEISIILGSVC
jgi:hypothetical protein